MKYETRQLIMTEDKCKISCETIGELNGKKISKITLSNGVISVVTCNIGCTILSIHTPDRQNITTNIVSGFENIENYLVNKEYIGSIVGRYANRIAGGRFSMNGEIFQLTVNENKNHLHGGKEGFNKKIWDILEITWKETMVGVTFKYISKDREEGYPGNLDVFVTYLLDGENRLHLQYSASTDMATPVNITNHSYFNLTGFTEPAINNHLLQVNASGFTEKNQNNIPTGIILPVSNTSLDFRKLRKIGDHINDFPIDKGYDHNFVLNKAQPGGMSFAAKLYEPQSGRYLNVYTTEPALQIYTANYWDGLNGSEGGNRFQQHGAVALETQAFPDSPNHPAFPDTILYPGEKYISETIFEFGVE